MNRTVKAEQFRKPWYLMLMSFFWNGFTFGLVREFSFKYSYFGFYREREIGFWMRLKIFFVKYFEYMF